MDGDSSRPSWKRLGIPVSSRLPVVEGETLLGVMVGGSLRTEVFESPESECPVWTVDGETLADGVSTRALGMMCGGSLRTAASRSIEMEDASLAAGVLRKKCKNCQTRGYGEDEMASSQKNSQSRAFHHWRGFTPWSTLNETSPLSALPSVLSHSGTLRKHIQRFHTLRLVHIVSCMNGTFRTQMQWRREDEAVDEAPDPVKHGNADWPEESKKKLALKSSLSCIQTSGGSSRGSLNSVNVSGS